jgi:hypothetical protein
METNWDVRTDNTHFYSPFWQSVAGQEYMDSVFNQICDFWEYIFVQFYIRFFYNCHAMMANLK